MAFGAKDERGIYRYGEDDTAENFSSLLDLGMSSVHDATKFFADTAAKRAALSPAPEGAFWQDTDQGKRLWRGDNGAWVLEEPAWVQSGIGADSAAFQPPPVGTKPIIKTGYVKVGLINSAYTINFPTPFPNQCLHVSCTTMEGAAVAPYIGSRGISRTGAWFLWPGVGNAVVAFTYMAVGY